MNILDKTIGWFSPDAALRRVKTRAIASQVDRLSYDGAKAGRRTDGWFRPGSSANAETSSGLVALRDGASDLVRNNPLAAKALIEFATKVVGTQIRPQARTGNPGTNAILDAKFEQWSKQTRYYQMQALGLRAIAERGEAIVRYYPRRPEDGLAVPLQPRLLEGDYIDHVKQGQTDGGGYIVQGIEFDALDNEVAAWMFPAHPGDTINTAWIRRTSLVSYRVPIAGSNPLMGYSRGYRQDRPGQVRGASWFAPIIASMWDLNGYEEAERVRKRIESCLAAFVTSPDPNEGGMAIGAQATNSEGDIVEEFRPGMIPRLRPGENVTIAEPKAAGGYAEYTRRQDRLIAAGLGLLYELLTGDLSQVNYSSYRGGLVGFRDWIETIQWHLMIPWICEPTWTRFVDAAKIAGIVPTDTTYDVEWSPPAFDLLDRLAEADADEREMRIGTSTWDQSVARRGYDPNKQMAQIAMRNAEFDKAGIILDIDPRNVARNGAIQKNPIPTEPQQPAA